jgi:hypothetical protein
MKKIYPFFITLASVLLISVSCTKDMMEYNGPEGIYFAVQNGYSYLPSSGWPYVPFTNVEFVKTIDNEVSVNILLRATGQAKTYPRTVEFQVVSDSTNAVEGVHYTMPNSVTLEAGHTETYIPVTLKRTEDMKSEIIKLQIKLLANNDFSLIFQSWQSPKDLTYGTIYEGFDASRHNILCSDIITKPTYWQGSYDVNTMKEYNAFGEFSQKKFLLIQSLMGYTYDDFMSSETMTYGVRYAISRYMSNYLLGKYKAHEPVLEDDGRLMWFDYCPWSSYIGVPWDGVYVEY